MFCRKCGFLLAAEDMFCSKCGTKISAEDFESQIDDRNCEKDNCEESGSKKPVWVRQVNITPQFQYLCVGDIGRLDIVIFPDHADDAKSLVWESSNEDIVEVSNSGYVRAKSKGTAILTLKGEILKTSIEVLVKEKATGVVLSSKKISLKRGGVERIYCNPIPKDAGVGEVEWVLDNNHIGTLSVAPDHSYCDFESAMSAIGMGNIYCTPKVTGERLICPVTVKLETEMDNAIGVLVILFGISLFFAFIVNSFVSYIGSIVMPVSLVASIGFALHYKGKRKGYNVLAILNMLLILLIMFIQR